ncbi:hypothetical protein F6Y02_27335 [Bacillus megaterium]|nr:hypothetical protein [Priestia megaterium]
MDIEVVREELNGMVSDVSIVMRHLQSSDQFKYNIDKDLQEHFFHLFVKSKRNFQAINVLMESDELENGFVESTVLLRVLAEGYFHFCYLLETEKETVLKEFETLKNLKFKKMLNGKQYRIKIRSHKERILIKDLRNQVENSDSEIPIHLRKMHLLAEKTNNLPIYRGVYEMFNTYVHFNPTTYISYGAENEEGIFTFDQYKPRPYLETRLLYFSVSIIMLLLARVYIYLDIETVPSYIAEIFNDWEKFKKERVSFIMESTHDYN